MSITQLLHRSAELDLEHLIRSNKCQNYGAGNCYCSITQYGLGAVYNSLNRLSWAGRYCTVAILQHLFQLFLPPIDMTFVLISTTYSDDIVTIWK